ncbi:hypothetical protein [Streptococcus pneumoniae]|uniref:hypothetical protein n=1 Tax=Streptococcus pneumoniae TaxID=1313 RepID=UPI000A63582A|nr:hypothetical protein [Streptococcus pneumoniae]
MKIKEQTRKLAAGCSKHCFEVADRTDEVSSKHCFEVVDRTDEVSSKHRFEVVGRGLKRVSKSISRLKRIQPQHGLLYSRLK